MQKTEEKAAKNRRKKRSAWEKEGRFKYLNRKLQLIREEVRQGFKRVDSRMRVLTNTLAPFMEVDEQYIMSIICQDEADEALLAYLESKGDQGITPTEACRTPELRRYRFKPYHITRRIQRMNKRLKTELGKPVSESYSRRWVLTSFVQRSLTSPKEELEKETLQQQGEY